MGARHDVLYPRLVHLLLVAVASLTHAPFTHPYSVLRSLFFAKPCPHHSLRRQAVARLGRWLSCIPRRGKMPGTAEVDLKLTIVMAEKLIDMDSGLLGDRSDPYCECVLDHHGRKLTFEGSWAADATKSWPGRRARAALTAGTSSPDAPWAEYTPAGALLCCSAWSLWTLEPIPPPPPLTAVV